MARLGREFPNGADLETEYYRIMDTQGRDAALKFLERNGELEAYWNRKDEIVTRDPLLAQYYASMDQFERVAQDRFERQMAQKYPGLFTTLDQYYEIKGRDEEAGKAFFREHPEIAAYYKDRDAWTVQLDRELMEMSEKVRNLEPQFATLREDAEFTHPGQRSVGELIESGSRPMGDFVLPEDLPARQIAAEIGTTIDALEAAGWNRSQIYKALKKMGDLDDVLNAFYEFRNTGTVMANDTKLRALLAALASMQEGTVRTPVGGGSGRGSGGSGGRMGSSGTRTGGGRMGRSSAARRDPTIDPITRSRQNPRPPREKIRSQKYGGASQAPQTEQQQAQQSAQFAELVGTLQSSSPAFYGLLRNMADIATPEAMAAWLDEPAHAHFKAWLLQAQAQGLDLKGLLAYIKEVSQRPITRMTQRRERGNRTWFTRVSNPLL
jgi:hypothetical protein